MRLTEISMGPVLDSLTVLCLFVEVALLLYLEKLSWKTIYTPLSFVMLPYTAVLVVTLLVAGSKFGFVEFYYPSIILWIVGIALFAIPSLTLGYVANKSGIQTVRPLENNEMPPIVLWIGLFCCVAFLYHLRQMSGSSAEDFGSDSFGEEFSGGGFWGQLRQLTIPILIMAVYYADRTHWWLWLIVVLLVIVSLINQVKGWTIIPCLAGLAMRIYTGRLRVTLKLMAYVIIGAFAVFFISYGLSILFVQKRGVSGEFMEFLFGHFFHYLTSGTLGLSMDMERGFPDAGGDFEMIIAQVVNLFRHFTGDGEMVNPLNPLYFNTGITLTNVRTLFGTLYINSNAAQFVLYILFLSTLMYMLKLAMARFSNIYVYTIYFFNCILLFMSWFDLYFASLIVFEMPVITLLLWLCEWMLAPRHKSIELSL